MILIVGATGVLGMEICRRLREAGRAVRGLYREGSDPAKVARLREMGVELARGDLKDRPSLDRACRGAQIVIETASSTLSRQEGDSIDAVDRDGSLALVAAAKAASVEHFVYISFPEIADEFPLQDAKRAVERELRASGLPFTILQPTFFMEIWLSPALGFDVGAATARIYGAGDGPISWISLGDVAAAAIASIDNPAALNRSFELGGPEALSHNQVIAVFEELTGRAFAVERVSEADLRERRAAARDPQRGVDALAQSFDALMFHCVEGKVIDMRPALAALPIELTPLRAYAARSLGRQGA
ncbi:SDR family oxidoreductase [Sorangium sp. So ce1078]|uniref:SDR family oxidoreductase n=1 Tax=Sorangium sp. So ce1078 TaxID=3133329 RepID=UPI003F628678